MKYILRNSKSYIFISLNTNSPAQVDLGLSPRHQPGTEKIISSSSVPSHQLIKYAPPMGKSE